MPDASPRLIPLWLKVAYTTFVAILIPVYLKNYGPTNFLYFCDVALLMTVAAIWLESPLLASAALVGIFTPQMLWVIDFFCESANRLGLFAPPGRQVAGLTGYMFEPPFFLRFLSFFHFWLPFLLLYLVWRVGYDKRGVLLWTVIAWALVTICYAYMPPPSPSKDPAATGAMLRDANQPVNINYVYGLEGDEKAQTSIDPDTYVALYLLALVCGIFIPTHYLCAWLLPGPRKPSDA